ncbi:MAG: RHS repeat-associated core domain-containing protein [Patescibacteria group bacterium]
MTKKSTTIEISLYLLFFSLLIPVFTPVFASASDFKVNIYLGDQKLGTADNNGINYYLTDHLGSPTIITNQAGEIVETNDYESYGRVKESNSQIDNQYKYTGKPLDNETNLQYYGARYLDSQLGRLISVDPAVLKLNNDKSFEEKYNRSIQHFLSNPQNLNSYSYAVNNPVKYIDDNGEIFWVPVILGAIASAFTLGIPIAQAPGNNYNPQTANVGETRDFIGSIVPAYNNLSEPQKFGVLFVTGAVAEKSASKIAGSLVGKNFGKLGTVVANESGKLTNLIREEVAKPFHGLDQAITKGVSPNVLLNTLKNPLITFKQSGDRTLYLTREAGVVLDNLGRLVTTYSKEHFKDHIKNVIKLFD